MTVTALGTHVTVWQREQWWCETHDRAIAGCAPRPDRPACTCGIEWLFGSSVNPPDHAPGCPVSGWIPAPPVVIAGGSPDV